MNIQTKYVRQPFVGEMDKELIANESKGNWNEWKPSVESALSELDHHIAKLKEILNAPWHVTCRREVSEYSADVANIAMKIEEMFGWPSLERTEDKSYELLAASTGPSCELMQLMVELEKFIERPTKEQIDEIMEADNFASIDVYKMDQEQRKQLHISGLSHQQ